MVDLIPEFEQTDSVGSDGHYADSVGLTEASIPAVADKDIEEIWIRCPEEQPPRTQLEYSYDGGTTWSIIVPGDERYYEPRAGRKQIKVKASGQNMNTARYEIDINFGQT